MLGFSPLGAAPLASSAKFSTEVSVTGVSSTGAVGSVTTTSTATEIQKLESRAKDFSHLNADKCGTQVMKHCLQLA